MECDARRGKSWPKGISAYPGNGAISEFLQPALPGPSAWNAPLGDTSKGIAPLRAKGVYLITGGLGGIGLALAEYLAQAAQARLVLIGRSVLPLREQWTQWLADHDADDPVSRKIRKIWAIEELGAEVLIVKADVSNQDDMRRVIARTHAQFGKMHGVIHAAGVPRV